MMGIFVQVNEDSTHPRSLAYPIGYVIQENGCWEWVGVLDGAGYGHWTVGRKSRGAHRVMYERMKGPIPEGLTIDHLCRNKACVNPDHLEAVTQWENNWRHSRIVEASKQKWRKALHEAIERGEDPEEFCFRPEDFR